MQWYDTSSPNWCVMHFHGNSCVYAMPIGKNEYNCILTKYVNVYIFVEE